MPCGGCKDELICVRVSGSGDGTAFITCSTAFTA